MVTIAEKLKKLDLLWGITKEDWYLTVSYSLTEPYAPTAIIAPEGSNMLRYAAWGDSIEEAIDKAIEMVHQEVILGNKIAPESPVTNPDDHKPRPWQPE